MQVRFPGESYSGLLEECGSKVMDPPQQKPSAGLKKFATKVQEDQVNQQSEEDEKSEQRMPNTSGHRDI